jgi:hypothetical protein
MTNNAKIVTTIGAAGMVLVLGLIAGPAFARTQTCANVFAEPSAFGPDIVQYCKQRLHHPGSTAGGSGIPACGHGTVPVWHDQPMTAHPHWSCVKPS